MSKKVNITVFPKIVLLAASVICLIDLFLPWTMEKSLVETMPYSVGWLVPLVLIGSITLILNIIALTTKNRGVNLAANIISLVGGLILVGEVLLQVIATSSFGFDASEYQAAFWIELIVGIIFFVFSIVSMATSKTKD